MKNIIVTIVCILAIVVVTAVVAFTGNREAYDLNFEIDAVFADN